MRRKTLKLFWALVVAVIPLSAFGGDLTLELNFPAPGGKKAAVTVVPISAPEVVGGNVVLDISPYPVEFEPERYLAEYFLNDTLIYSGAGDFNEDTGDFSFRCLFDTTRFADGDYRLIVNFWDKKSPPGIGIIKIRIKNDDE